MKTTSYEISKKLKEAGFKDSYIYAWYSDSEGLPWIQEIQHAKPTAVNKYGEEVKLTFTAPAYDLETLFNILPKTYNKKQLKIWVWYDSVYIIYQDSDGFSEESITTKKQKNESLADTAGKMLIKLYEAGIINFKK